MRKLFKGRIEDLKSKIWGLDLEPIMVKLMDPEEGEGWSLEVVTDAVERYRRFLFLSVTEPVSIVPTKNIDKVWHAHILDTSKYREDCANTFGFFLDHFPYFGMRSPEDRADLNRSFEHTTQLYTQHFGEAYTLPLGNSTVMCTGGGCEGGGCDAVISPPALNVAMCDGGGDGSSCDSEYVGLQINPNSLITANARPRLNLSE